jgi:hypothetical protein
MTILFSHTVGFLFAKVDFSARFVLPMSWVFFVAVVTKSFHAMEQEEDTF